jgi:hypothetical protein
MKIVVEYDGELHFKSVNYYGGDEALNKTKIRDDIKTKYCLNNNINLLRIKYDENIIEKLNRFVVKNE